MKAGIQTSTPPRRRPGGRSARVVRAVLDATIDVLASQGYAAMSIEDVAVRAGVSRTTVYRRWATKQDLVRAVLIRLAQEHPTAADTGTIRGDLIDSCYAKLTPELAERDERLIRALMSDFGDPELLALAQLTHERLQAPSVAAVERAIARGELPADTDPKVVLDTIFAAVHVYPAVFREPLEPGLAERVIDLVLAGARAGGAVRRKRSA